MTLAAATCPSPVGALKLVGGPRGLIAVLWANDPPTRVRLGPMAEQPGDPLLIETARQLRQYFSGTRRGFDLPLDLVGTAFQKEVWMALLRIPFGETRSYGEIARDIGRPKAVRAVGAANGRNPLSIIAPCHRVIGASGALTGFAGGLSAKSALLAIEGHDLRAKLGPTTSDPRRRRLDDDLSRESCVNGRSVPRTV